MAPVRGAVPRAGLGADRFDTRRRSWGFGSATGLAFSGGGPSGSRGYRRLVAVSLRADPDRTTAGRSGTVSSGLRAFHFIVVCLAPGSFLESMGGSFFMSAEGLARVSSSAAGPDGHTWPEALASLEVRLKQAGAVIAETAPKSEWIIGVYGFAGNISGSLSMLVMRTPESILPPSLKRGSSPMH